MKLWKIPLRRVLSTRSSNDAKTLVLTAVRHGETDNNKEQRLQGQSDAILNGSGVKQAILAGHALRYTPFDIAYSSDLKRAKTTCQYIIEGNKRSKISVNDIIEDELIKERDFGELENLLFSQFVSMAKKANLELSDVDPARGESLLQVRERGRAFLINKVIKDALQVEHDRPSVLMVSHGLLLRELFIIFFEEMKCSLPPHGHHHPGDHLLMMLQKNTSWSRFELDIKASDDGVILGLRCLDLYNINHLNGN